MSCGVALTQCGEPVRRCSTKYPIIGDPPSLGGLSQRIVTTSGAVSGVPGTRTGLPGGDGGSTKYKKIQIF